MKIVVPNDFPSVFAGSAAEAKLKTLGDVTVYSERGADVEDELIRRIAGADVVVTMRAHSKYNARVLDATPTLRLISVWGTGTDNVDSAACAARGIEIANTPGANANAVAEHTLAFMLALARRITTLDTELRAGRWTRGLSVGLDGKTLGLVGLGAIANRVAKLAAPFGMRILACPWGADDGRAAQIGAVAVPIEQLLAESDFVSLHLRLSAKTEGFLDARRLSLMKPTAFLINTARAALVDRDALLSALREGRIAGAALDVFHTEPLPADDPLLAFSNTVITPHNAGMTPQAVDAGLQMAVDNVARFIATQR
ncbi:MAG: phosphoglycerate dehydrogenase [Gemmatimonadaceae bacterium]